MNTCKRLTAAVLCLLLSPFPAVCQSASGDHAFSSSDIEGNSSPTPVIDLQLDSDVGLSARVGRDALFGSIAGDVLSDQLAVAVLSADGAAEHIFSAQGLNGMFLSTQYGTGGSANKLRFAIRTPSGKYVLT